MADIALRGISKYYGDAPAVLDVDLRVADRSFHTLLGPSGCGKTSTLRMIAGLERPTTGSIQVGGKTVFSAAEGIVVAPSRRNVGLIFQDYALWPHMSVMANVGFGLEVQKLPLAQRRQRVEAILRRVHLEGLEHRMPGELSGGQQQRVAMARMLVVEPQVLLMDEPLSNLDAKLRLSMRSEIKGLHGEIGATTVYVTHDQREALEMSDAITVMDQGRIQQTASPSELYERPANLFVAGFVGSPAMNLLRGRVVRAAGQRLVVALEEAGEVSADSRQAQALEPGTGVVLGVRPEDLSLAPAGAGAYTIPATIRTVLPAGSEIFVELRADGATLTVRVERRTEVKPDSRASVRYDPAEVHVFDQSTGRRLE